MPTPLFPIPGSLQPPANDAAQLWNAEKYHETISLCEQQLAALEKQILAPRSGKQLLPPQHDPASPGYQYFALTLLLVGLTLLFMALTEWIARRAQLGGSYFPGVTARRRKTAE